MLSFTRSAIIFSAKCFAAAGLALLIGFWLDLPRPYWAVMTAYIVSEPSSGAVRSKALFRVIGTLLGAAFTVLTVPALVDAPALLSLVLALWVGLCLGVSLLNRSPRSYALMLAGYTATLIGFPSVTHPELIFDVAVSRVEEITLGILCATLVHSLVLPRPVGLAIRQKLSAWVAEADAWALDLVRPAETGTVIADRRHLAAAATEIQLLSILLPFDTSHLRQSAAIVRALHRRLIALIPILSGIEDRLTALAEQGADAEIAQAARALTGDWIAAGADQAGAAAVLDRLRASQDASQAQDWPALLTESLLLRLADLVTNLGEAHALLAAFDAAPRALPPALGASLKQETTRRLQGDLGLAATSGLSATLSILIVCAVWILTGWPEGAIAAALAGVFCALFAALDDPTPPIVAFGIFSGLAIPVAALYQFAILPAIDGFVMLAVVLAPAFLIGGVAMADRRTGLPGLAFVLGLSSALAVQETFSTDFAGFINSNLAQYVALFIALVVTRTMRSISVEAAARRLLARTWKTLAAVARDQTRPHVLDVAALLVDRLGLLTPKLAATRPDTQTVGVDALRDLRVGMNLVHLKLAGSGFTEPQRTAMMELLTRVGRHYADLSAGRVRQPQPALLDALDRCLAITAMPSTDRTGVAALVGLRRNMFPHAPAFQPPLIQELPR